MLYQLDARTALRGLGDRLGRPATFDDVPDRMLDAWAGQSFDWIYWLGVWRTGAAGRAVSRGTAAWVAGYRAILPDLEVRDICGSCFAVTRYEVAPEMGGDAALMRLRARMRRRGMRLMLDFVPNHVALDHPWVEDRPELLMAGTAAQLAAEPGNYVRLGAAVLAHGRDPNFPGWPDTLQLDYADPATVAAMRGELMRAAGLCDGLRCDMAMLLLPEVFKRSWGKPALPFWAEAIAAVRRRDNDFLFMAEVYWGLDGRLLQLGFDLAYDKTLYDRVLAGDAGSVLAHLRAGPDEQRRMARFLENHDEPRAARAFAWDRHQAAAVLTFCTPGLRFFHEGQLEGRQVQGSVHLDRVAAEPVVSAIADFYRRLLGALADPALQSGRWTLLEPDAAWDGNWTWSRFVAFAWEGPAEGLCLGVVNFLPHAAQCFVRLPLPALAGSRLRLEDALGPACYERDGDELLGRGMYFDLPAWGYHLFRVRPAE